MRFGSIANKFPALFNFVLFILVMTKFLFQVIMDLWVIVESLGMYNTKLKAQRVCFEIDPNLRGLYAI